MKKIANMLLVFFISDDKENEILTRLDSGEMYARGIDTTTLAIHFPDMLDSQGNKIFASLSEDGKGASIIEGDCTIKNFPFSMKDIYIYKENYKQCKAIGIQK